MSKEPNIQDLVGAPHRLREALDSLQRSSDLLCEAAIIQARLKRASFNALREQGFTDEQALELCKSPLQ